MPRGFAPKDESPQEVRPWEGLPGVGQSVLLAAWQSEGRTGLKHGLEGASGSKEGARLVAEKPTLERLRSSFSKAGRAEVRAASPGKCCF